MVPQMTQQFPQTPCLSGIPEKNQHKVYLKKPCYGINFKISKIMQNRQLERIKRTYYAFLPNVWDGKHKALGNNSVKIWNILCNTFFPYMILQWSSTIMRSIKGSCSRKFLFLLCSMKTGGVKYKIF